MGVGESRMGSPTSSFSTIAALGGRCDQQRSDKQDAVGADIFWAMTEPCLAVGGPGTSGGNSKILGTPFIQEYSYHKDDRKGAPRTNSPDDVLSDLSMKAARSSPVCVPESTAEVVVSSTSSTSPTVASPLKTDVGQTAPSINFFIGHGKRLRPHDDMPHDDETGRTASFVAGVEPIPVQSQECSEEPTQSPRTTARPARHSAPEAQSPLVLRMNTCTECHTAFSGPTYMLNDLAYCCQRHRLLAYQKVPKAPHGSGVLSASEADLHVLLPTGVRASFCAWI